MLIASLTLSQAKIQTSVAVEQKNLLLRILEEFPLQHRVDHQHAIALLDVVPADEERHDVAAVAEQPRIAACDADGAEDDEHRRRDEPGKDVARLHRAAEVGPERLSGEAAIEDLVRRGEVRMVHEMRDQKHRRRNRRSVVGLRQHEEERQQEQRASAEAKEIDRRAEEEPLVAGFGF